MKFSLPQAAILDILCANNCDLTKVNVVAVRGFDLSAGKPGVNDRQIYDDLVAVYSPHGVQCFQHNTDPNGYRVGSGTGSSKGMGMLAPGIHLYGPGLHKGRPGFRQCEPFTLIRDGNPPYRDTGWHAANWHSGGYTSTSSLACQTNKPPDFAIIHPLIVRLLKQFNNPLRRNDRLENVPCFNYLLIDETDRLASRLVVSRRYFS